MHFYKVSISLYRKAGKPDFRGFQKYFIYLTYYVSVYIAFIQDKHINALWEVEVEVSLSECQKYILEVTGV